jgi:hypothetical protein
MCASGKAYVTIWPIFKAGMDIFLKDKSIDYQDDEEINYNLDKEALSFDFFQQHTK